jgi:general secretion pathway protein A
MYTSFFGLHEKPFSITPDPRYLYLSERHAEALAHLLYGITESGGFIQLTGEVGTGKTTVVRSLLEQLPGGTDVALVLNPNLSPREFLLAICEELRVELTVHDRQSLKAIVDALNKRLLDAHAIDRRVVLIVDEAQNLSPEVLEQIRLLTNLETAKRKLLQIILIGQPELRHVLDRNDLRQLAQRITGRYHLEPLDREETRSYVGHRMQVAGGNPEIFSRAAIATIYRAAGGVPRLINVISDRALLGAYSREQKVVSRRLAQRAANEVSGEEAGPRPPRWLSSLLGGVVAAAVLAMLGVAIWRIAPIADERAPPPAAESRTAGQATAMPVPAATPAGDPSLAMSPGTRPNTEAALTGNGAPPGSTATEVALGQTAAPAGSAAGGLTAVPSAPAEPVLTLEQQLTGAATATDTDSAFRTLLELWNVSDANPDIRPCDAAEANGLRCLYEQGSWRELVNLDRPAILTLTMANYERHQVILTGMTRDGEVLLRAGSQRLAAPLSELMSMWDGEYLLIWRPATGPGRTLTDGAFGPDVLWLRNSLATVLDTDLPAARPDRYDPVLADAVRRFQATARLVPDGIAGARTMIALNSALELPERYHLEREG